MVVLLTHQLDQILRKKVENKVFIWEQSRSLKGQNVQNGEWSQGLHYFTKLITPSELFLQLKS